LPGGEEDVGLEGVAGGRGGLVGARGADVTAGRGGGVEGGGGGRYECVEVLYDGVVYCGAGEAEEVCGCAVRWRIRVGMLRDG